jgi:glycine betaine/proline transport system ATP-binding protein
VINPAGGHIARFVKDVNRDRFIKIDAVMKAGPQGGGGALPRLRSGITHEEAAKQLAESMFDQAAVTNRARRPLGPISLRRISAALSGAADPRLEALQAADDARAK